MGPTENVTGITHLGMGGGFVVFIVVVVVGRGVVVVVAFKSSSVISVKFSVENIYIF